MAFLSPLFLLGALAASVPVVLHLLRREPEARVKFAAVHLLQHAPVEHADRRRLRQLLLLALRVSALVLLALAFARPFLASGAAASATGVTMIALDTSYSLSPAARFARAQQLATEAIQQAPSGHLVGVVTFADRAQVVAAPSGDRALAVAAVAAARPGFGGTRYRAALATAADAFAGRPGSLIVVTDLQATGWDAGERVDVPEQVHVQVADVGPAPDNLAIVGARLAGDRVVATVRNSGATPRDLRVRLTVDDAAAGEAAGSVGPQQMVDVMLPASRGTAARVEVDDPDGIQADNVRYLVLAESGRPSVLVITSAGDLGRDALYAQQALAAGGMEGASFEVSAASGADISGWDAARLSRHAALMLLSTRGLDQRGRELIAAYLKDGGGVLLAVGPETDGEVAAGALGTSLELTALPPVRDPHEARTLAPVDPRHPVFRTFASDAATLGLVKFRQIAAVRGAACQPLARFSSGEPALLECIQGEGRTLVLASDLDSRWNDFPLHATFVPFLHEAMGYLAGSRGRSSGFVVGNVPAGVPAEPGIAAIQATGGTGQRVAVAVNVDPRESDPGRVTAEEFQAAVVPLKDRPGSEEVLEARQQEERQNLWRYAILLVIVALVAESLLAARTA